MCGLTAKNKTDNNQNYRYGKNNNDGRNHAPFVHTRQSRFVQTDTFDITGGVEANVAVSCAHYGHEAYFFFQTAQARNKGQAAVKSLCAVMVYTLISSPVAVSVWEYIIWKRSFHASVQSHLRPCRLIIAEASPADFDFDAIMEGADWFHWSGITPAISDASAECLRQACIAAKKHGVKPFPCDLTFRKKLLDFRKAQSIMKPLMQYVDVCIGNEEDAELCLGFQAGCGRRRRQHGSRGLQRHLQSA